MLLMLPRRRLLKGCEERIVGTEPAAASAAMRRTLLESEIEELGRCGRCNQRRKDGQHNQRPTFGQSAKQRFQSGHVRDRKNRLWQRL
jgi:hypothetical protein